jgi:thiol-disulfide isomerase/thioredoxin
MKRVLALLIVFVAFAMHPSNGSKSIDFSIEDVNGKEFKLSSIKKKMILLDFWASWCGPCRPENPNIVEAYEKYSKAKFEKGKGLEIVSVSLDRDREKWKAAIETDNLWWKYHGYDEGGKVAKLYGITSIPYSLLIDGEGNIVAQGNELRGLNLHITLDKFIKQ